MERETIYKVKNINALVGELTNNNFHLRHVGMNKHDIEDISTSPPITAGLVSAGEGGSTVRIYDNQPRAVEFMDNYEPPR